MEDFDLIIQPPYANPIVIQWLKRGSAKILPNGCWEWQLSIVQSRFKQGKGYGRLYFGGKTELAHRLAINAPVGLCALHSCDFPSCVNPWHLKIGTQAENILDMKDKGRKLVGSSINPICTECPRVAQNGMKVCGCCQSKKMGRHCACGAIASFTSTKCGSCYMKERREIKNKNPKKRKGK